MPDAVHLKKEFMDKASRNAHRSWSQTLCWKLLAMPRQSGTTTRPVLASLLSFSSTSRAGSAAPQSGLTCWSDPVLCSLQTLSATTTCSIRSEQTLFPTAAECCYCSRRLHQSLVTQHWRLAVAELLHIWPQPVSAQPTGHKYHAIDLACSSWTPVRKLTACGCLAESS